MKPDRGNRKARGRNVITQAHPRSFSVPLCPWGGSPVQTMTQNDVIDLLQKRIAGLFAAIEAMKNDDVMIIVPRESLVAVVKTLQTGSTLGFTTLMNHLGADYGDRFAVIYNLYSPGLRRKVTVKSFLDREQPEVASLEPLFPGISWYERETFDMFGIRFINHRSLKRLLLPDDWTGHPLRKDYVYPESYNGLTTAREPLSAPSGSGEPHV